MKKILKILGFISIIFIGIFIFIYKNFYISIEMNNKEKIFEYGEKLNIEQPKAFLKGKYIFKEGFDISNYIIINKDFNEEKLGIYNISYSIKYLLWNCLEKEQIEIIDTKFPILELIGEKEIELSPSEQYIEEGFIASDNYDGNITSLVNIDKVFEENKEIITYRVMDSSNNEVSAYRIINYVDRVTPILTLNELESNMYIGDEYKEINYNAIDDVDGNITDKVNVDLSEVNFEKVGTYNIYYKVKDNFNNETICKRVLTIKSKPIITNSKTIYLTFDDGPCFYTKDLLDILDKYNVKVTFFVANKPKYNYLIKEAYEKGHVIGIHSLTHDYATIYSSKEAYYKDLYAMSNIIKEQIGVEVDILRFPGGSSNKVSIKACEGIMTELTKDVIEKGYQYFDWNVTSGDAGDVFTTEEVYNNVINGIKNKKVSIVLQHDTKKFSIDAVEDIIKWGLDNGYTFSTLTKDSFPAHHSVNN